MHLRYHHHAQTTAVLEPSWVNQHRVYVLNWNGKNFRNRDEQPFTLTIAHLEIPYMHDFGLPRTHGENKPPPAHHCTNPLNQSIRAKCLIPSFTPKHNLKTGLLTLKHHEAVRTSQNETLQNVSNFTSEMCVPLYSLCSMGRNTYHCTYRNLFAENRSKFF